MAGVIVNDNNKFLERVVAFVVVLTLLRLDIHELSGIYWYLNFKKKKNRSIFALFLSADNDLKRKREIYIYTRWRNVEGLKD